MMAASITNSNIITDIRQAEAIAPIDRHEAAQVAAFELEQILNLLEQLNGDDWQQPTDCTEWNVQDMTAHLAGGCAGWASMKHFLRQTVLNPHMRRVDVPVDAINRRELEDRVHKTPRQLVDELRQVGPIAVRNRRILPALLRRIRIDAKPMPGKMTIAYLVDVIYPRDQWMHRMDICRATGKTWVSNPDHDTRMLDLIMLDVAQTMAGRFPVIVNITGALNVAYRFGSGEAQTEIETDLFTFNRRASARIKTGEALETARIHGNRDIAEDFLQNCEVLY